jgi:inhibitor of KinA
MSVVYTAASPGGWHVLGRTPAPLFDVRRTDPVLLAPGDEVVFEAISRDAYDRLAAQAAAGLWVPAPEPQQAAAS